MSGAAPYGARPSRAAVVDLGSNSVKVVCYEADRAGAYRPYRRESAKMRLDEYGNRMVGRGAMDELMPVLAMYRNILQYEGVDRVYAVATSAVRNAANGEFLVDAIRRETGFGFTVLSGWEEALCSYAGAAGRLNIPTSLLFDLGGGSLEIVSARNHAILRALSLPLGALVLTRRFAGDSDPDARAVRRLREHIRGMLPDIRSLGPRAGGAALVGVGGAVRSMARYIQGSTGYPLKKLHNYTMDPRTVHDAARRILSTDRGELARTYEIGRGRADIIKAGAVAVSELVSWSGSRGLTVSSVGLREGVLALATRYSGLDSDTISEYHVRELVRPPRSRRRMPTGASSVVRFVQSSGLLGAEEFRILWAAAADIESLRTFRDADDFAYRMMDRPSAMSHRVQLLAAMSLAHSKKPKRTRLLAGRYAKVLRPGDRRTIARLAPILALCEMAMTAEADAELDMDGGGVRVRLRGAARTVPHVLLQRACARAGAALGVGVRAVA